MDKIKEAALSFAEIAQVPVTCFNVDGEIQWEFLAGGRLCDHFNVYRKPGGACVNNLQSSAKMAAQLGGAYTFLCRAGLANIAFSTIIQGKVTGYLIAGPILMGELKESIFSNIISANGLGFDSYSKVIMLLKNMRAFEPKGVSRLANLFESSILGAITPNEDYLKLNKRYYEMQKIAESLQKYKKENKVMPYPHELEAKLIQKAKNGDVKESMEIFHAFLQEVSVIEAGDLPSIRTKILNLCSVLLRLSVEKAGLNREDTEQYYAHMDAVGEAESIPELSVHASEFIEQAVHALEHDAYSGNSQIVKRAISYIHENYKNKISLSNIAEALHTSPSYLSMLFKHETGATITDYLNQIRIEKSRELLSESTMGLLDVSIQSGFENQSYFSKVFKKINGVTPKEYRKSSLQ